MHGRERRMCHCVIYGVESNVIYGVESYVIYGVESCDLWVES